MGEQIQCDEIHLVLLRTRLFDGCPPEAIDQVARGCELRTFSDGEVLAASGDPAAKLDGFWIVAEGCLECTRTWRNGERLVVAFQLAGQMTGMLPTFDGLPVAFDTRSRGPSRVVFVRSQAFLDAVLQYPPLTLSVLATLSRRSRIDYERIELLTLNSMRGRVAKTLMHLAREGMPRADMPAGKVPFRISQEDVADMLGVTRQIVNKEMRWFVDQGILVRRYNSVVVADQVRLYETATCEEPFSAAMQLLASDTPPPFYPTSD